MTRSAMTVVAVTLFFVGIMGGGAQAAVGVWDGGNDDFGAAKWNGGMTAAAVFGDNRLSNGAHTVTIGGGSTVTYAAPGTGNGIRPRSNVGPTTMTINEGSTFWQTTVPAGDADGMWTTFDADLNLDNGTFKRDWTPGGTAQAGGIFMFGSWRSIQNQEIHINLTNGGKIENDGQIWFGADEEHALGLEVSMTIDNGSLDLTGGAYPTQNDTNIVMADLAIWYGADLAEGAGHTGSGLPKGEEYEINFKGPGSITVDASGIWVYDQDSVGIWTATQSTYENLWTRGILRSDGVSGIGGTTFANHFTVTGTSGADDYKVTRKDPVAVVWDGGNGAWNSANWNTGQTLASQTGDGRGSAGGHAISIGGWAQVSYDAGVIRDLRLRMDNGPVSMTIKEGATLHLDSTNTDVDGVWTEYDGDLTLDNGTFRRTKGGTSLSGGILMFGSWRSKANQEIDISLTNGGRIENDGQLWFGADEEHGLGLDIHMTINDGSLDLTGGAYPEQNDTNIVSADLAFWYGTDQGQGNGQTNSGLPKDEDYSINFTGPGSITVDASGIWIYDQDSVGIWTNTGATTYEALWTRGILQANGLSGPDGATFGDYFTTSGTAGMDNYILNSLIGAVLPGDFNGDGSVDAADYVDWRDGLGTTYTQADYDVWRANFGRTAPGSGSAVGAGGAVPEPATLSLLCLSALCLFAIRRRFA